MVLTIFQIYTQIHELQFYAFQSVLFTTMKHCIIDYVGLVILSLVLVWELCLHNMAIIFFSIAIISPSLVNI